MLLIEMRLCWMWCGVWGLVVGGFGGVSRLFLMMMFRVWWDLWKFDYRGRKKGGEGGFKLGDMLGKGVG